MPVLDTGPIDNRREPRTTQLSIRLSNSGRLPAIAGAEVYHVNPSGGGFTNETIYQIRLVHLNPFGQPGSGFTVDHVFADLDVFGARIVSSGQGGKDVAVTITEHAADGQVIKEHVLTGEMARIRELLFAYVSNFNDDTITVMDTGTQSVVSVISLPGGSNPLGVAITPDGTRAYVANSESGTIAVIDTSSNTIMASISVPATGLPFYIAITPDGSRAYTANLGSPGSVTVIDSAENTTIATIPLPGEFPAGIAITPDGSRAYVANTGLAAGVVTGIDMTTNTILTNILLPDERTPTAIAIAPDGSRAYVATQGPLHSVKVIDTLSNTIIASLPTGDFSAELAITPILLF